MVLLDSVKQNPLLWTCAAGVVGLGVSLLSWKAAKAAELYVPIQVSHHLCHQSIIIVVGRAGVPSASRCYVPALVGPGSIASDCVQLCGPPSTNTGRGPSAGGLRTL